ncbi:MAG: DUF2752 domain-containing protein [Oscillospiraceae bacterium]|nr:DUF2752 domain-containing protein [Oscillospiraceae bacterium]
MIERIKKLTKKNTILSIVFLIIYLFLAQIVTGGTCVSSAIMGLPCPACGFTRAYLSAFRLDFAAAMRYNPLFWIVPVWGAAALYKNKRHGHERVQWFNILSWGTLSALFVSYAVRLVLYFPHTAPMVVNRQSLLFRVIGVIKSL